MFLLPDECANVSVYDGLKKRLKHRTCDFWVRVLVIAE